MTYNIYNGGSPDRLGAVVSVVNAERPDLLSLQELRDFERAGGRLLRRVADEIGMRPFLAGSRFGQPVAVFVRDGVRVVGAEPVHRPFHHGAQRVVVDTSDGLLTVVGAHLYPTSGLRRLWEARWLAASIQSGQSTLLMGDLNSLDPWTDHDAQLRAAPAEYRHRHLRRSSATVDTRAVAALAKAGLVDVYTSLGSSPDGYSARFCGMRLDYVMATAPLARRAVGCRIVTGPLTEGASDHFPVVAQFDGLSA